MLQVNMHEAKTRLSMLVEYAAKGEPFIIAKAGKPMVKVIPYVLPQKQQSRVGFLKGKYEVPDDFDRMGEEEIISLFEGTA
ncbi:MAG: type II toxin-antitoxin system prevent-host-death family antitoxin [Defluviitaleaceae bacterium]|nr:type II toxin-antitoxin system prevent-host-death family antitoxin [Defluviitaleaceae bacterium]